MGNACEVRAESSQGLEFLVRVLSFSDELSNTFCLPILSSKWDFEHLSNKLLWFQGLEKEL